jgi:chemotaxis protein MotB
VIKAKVKAKKENNERYLLTYSDLITLLCAFFIVMYASANTDAVKFQKLANSMSEAFNVGVLDGQTDTSHIDQGGASAQTHTFGMIEKDYEYVSQQLEKFAEEENLGSNISVKQNKEGIVISLSDRSLFASGRAELGIVSKRTLQKVAELLRQTNYPIRVEGNTDNVPTNNPDYPSNWDLSVARALTVVKFFIDEGGVSPGRLSAVGHGEFNPIVPNSSPENRSKNRRCDILIVYPNTGSFSEPENPPATGNSPETGNNR